MKCVSIWISRSTSPDTFERVVTYPIDFLVDEVKIKFEEIVK